MLTVNALNHKKAKTKKSDPRRVYFQCTEPGCQFCCHVFKGVDGLFRVVRWTWHTCSPFVKGDVKRSWVAQKAKQLLCEQEGLKPKDLRKDLREKHGIDVKLPAAMKAVSRARQEKDDEEASFDKMLGLFQALREQNPGTVAEIEVVDGRFSRAFLCPGPCARAWRHCPKLIALDGTHGSSAYKGVVLVATALDGAGQIFPIALALLPVKLRTRGGFSWPTSPPPSTSGTFP